MTSTPFPQWPKRLPEWWSDAVHATKGWLLFVLSLPALLATVVALGKGNLSGILVNGVGFALYLCAFVLLRRGVLAEKAQREKLFPRLTRPYKWMAAGMAALATAGMARYGAGHPSMVSALFGLVAFLGMYLAYGLEHPASLKSAVPPVSGLDRDAVLHMLESAERRLLGIEQARREIRNPEFGLRLERISDLAKGILADLGRDPAKMQRSRKFLNVYLESVEKVVTGYARTHAQVELTQLEDDFRDVLVAIEDTFRKQRQRLLDDEVFDLDVQMEVLATQLRREGIF